MVPRWVPLAGFVLLTVCIAPAASLAADPNDEAAVRAVVQTWVDRNNNQDADGVLALFAPEARIDSRSAGSKVSLGIYAASLKQLDARGLWGRNQEAKITSLVFPSPDRAVVELETSWDTRRTRQTEKQRWALTKRQERWLILEKDYLK